ncbi:MAG TPA: inositol polyphosphate kinase family protein [Methanosarcina sp.]|nr:inositol polyphosphate kinase family protein [Methanosarcina sp.]
MGAKSEPVGKQSLNLILMAGHAGSFREIDDGRKLAKSTNQKEYEIYTSPGELREIIPAAKRTSQDNQEASDIGKNVIIMQNLFYGIQVQSRMGLDIKIGKSTASRAQLFESGEKSRAGAFFKEMMMKLYDHYTKSSTRGWRAIPVDDGNRAKTGRNSEIFLRKQLDRVNVNKDTMLKNIISQLDLIKAQLEQSQKTFIASSVLIVIDLQNPGTVRAKLIDLAHPIDVNNKLFQKYKENFNEGINSLITFFRIYAAEQ